MTLHEAIVKLLKEKGGPMTTSEIADSLNDNKWYAKKDGSLITPYQIHGRTRKYPHLFNRQSSLVALIDQSFARGDKQKRVKYPPLQKAESYVPTSLSDLEKKLMDESRFKSANLIDPVVPAYPGLYCIRIKLPSALPKVFAEELRNRGHNIIYIGKASRNLNTRMLGQELRARGHGTFFRSMGAVLGYTPPKGSLVNKRNKRNFKFRPGDEKRIIAWINQNLVVNWVEFGVDIEKVESELILKYRPLLNLDGNPYAIEDLRRLRKECVRIANEL